MRYIISVVQHCWDGKLSFRHALYALRERPIAVTSKGETWVIDPDFLTDDENPMHSIKDTLAKLDPELLRELMEAAQFALNDVRVVKRVAGDLNIPVARVQALGLLATQLSVEPGLMPDITTVSQLDASQADLARAQGS